MSMTIDTGTADPVLQKPYPIAMKHYEWVKNEIEKLLAAKVICSSRSSWSAPIIVVPKGDRGKCLVIDYRALNKVTRKFTWPMPKVEDIFYKLNGATYFTTLDLRAGYHHIPLDKPSIPKTAFNSPFGKYEYVKVPFRLTQAPAYFQELMTGILKDFPFTIAYLDDIIIFSKTPQEHLSHIHKVFEKLETANLSMKKSKCNFFSKEIQYFGSHSKHYWHTTITLWNTCNSTHESTNNTEASQGLPWTGRILQKIYQRIHENSKTTHSTPLTTSKIRLDTRTSRSLYTFERSHCPGTHPPLPQHKQNLHHIHRCFWWCLWSTALPRTWWNRVPSCIPIPYIYQNTVQMEHHRTGSLWSILHNDQMELLPTGSLYNCPEWPQATSMIPEWQEPK